MSSVASAVACGSDASLFRKIVMRWLFSRFASADFKLSEIKTIAAGSDSVSAKKSIKSVGGVRSKEVNPSFTIREGRLVNP